MSVEVKNATIVGGSIVVVERLLSFREAGAYDTVVDLADHITNSLREAPSHVVSCC